MKYKPLSAPMLQLYALSMLYFTANAVLTIIFPLQASQEGMKEAEIGIMMGMYMFTCMLLRPWAGQKIAKYGVANVMKWLLVGHAVALLLYVLFSADSLYVVRILQGVVTACFSMAMQIAVADIVRDSDRGQGMSMYSMSTVLPGLYGPVVALLLWNAEALQTLSLFIVLLACLPLLLLIKAPLPNTKKDTVFTLKDMLHATKRASAHQGLVKAATIMLLSAAVFGALSAFLPLYLLQTNVANASVYLVLQAVVVLAVRFFFRAYIPSDGSWHPKFIAVILVSAAFGTALLVISDVPLLVYASAVLNGVATAMMYPTLTTYISFVVPNEQRHVLLGVFLASYDLGFSLGGFLTGFIVQFASYEVMFMTCTAISLLALAINFSKSKRMNSL